MDFESIGGRTVQRSNRRQVKHEHAEKQQFALAFLHLSEIRFHRRGTLSSGKHRSWSDEDLRSMQITEAVQAPLLRQTKYSHAKQREEPILTHEHLQL